MKFIDAYILAGTKRKTRRIRTSLVIIVSSLLFAVLFFIAFVAQGMLNTSQQVKNVGFNGRNLVNISSTAPPGVDFKAETEKINAELKAELKARGIKVTDSTQLDPSFIAEFSRRFATFANKVEAERQQKLETQVQQIGRPTALYHFASLDLSSSAERQTGDNADPYMANLIKQQENGGINPGNADPFSGFQFYSVERGMLRTQLQPGQTLAWQPGKPYPLIISYAYLEKLSGQSFNKVSSAARNQGYRKLMNDYAGKVLTFCYRNPSAQDQLQQTIIHNYKAAHDNDDSTKTVNTPTCAPLDQAALKKAGITSDSSSDSDAPKPLFASPPSPAPVTQTISFKIIGYVPSQSQYGGGDIVTQVLTSVSQLPTTPEMGIIPSDVVAADTLLQPQGSNLYGAYTGSNLYADFATRSDEKAFIDKGCAGNECGSAKNTKPYVQAFGSVSFALEGLFRTASKFLLFGAAGIMFIAALLIMFTISKVIADSTKEIAVFRSLGARRRDIAQIYYLYGCMLAVMALVLSVVLAAIGARAVASLYATRIADAFVKTTGAYNTDVHVNLLGINWKWLGAAAGALLVSALIGITIPILASLRRKLITILREE